MTNESTVKPSDAKNPNKPKKERTQAPPTKIVIRKLPSSFTEEEFKNAISPIPEHNYFSFAAADKKLGPNAYSRAYINFLNPQDIFIFRDRFDGYVFVDQLGNEFPAVVEYAPFQKIPKYGSQMKKDIRCGTIDEDADYLAFLEAIQNPETVTLPQIETLLEEIENLEKESRANNGVLKIKTPLLEYIEHRNAERLRPDKKRRKEFDRKKTRDDEKRKRKDIKEYRKDHYITREERDKERIRRREEDRIKWKERKEKEEKERQLRREKAERLKFENRAKIKEIASQEDKNTDESLTVVKPPLDSNSSLKTNKEFPTKATTVVSKEIKQRTDAQKTKRYSEARKREDKDRKNKEDKTKTINSSEALNTNKKCSEVEPKDDPLEEDEVEKEVLIDIPTDKEAEECVSHDKLLAHENEEDEGEEEEEDDDDNDEEDEENKEKEEFEAKEKDGDKKDNESAEDNLDFRKEKRSSKDPRIQRKIRNKDRPAMQLYRPGQSRLKTRLKQSLEEGNGERANGESSSSSSSPVMAFNEEKKEEKPKEVKVETTENKEDVGYREKAKGKDSSSLSASSSASFRGGPHEKKNARFRDSRSHNHYWEGEKEGYTRHRETSDDYDARGSKGGGGRKGYSYHHERENKGKWLGSKSSIEQEALAHQFKSLTFRRSTSQD